MNQIAIEFAKVIAAGLKRQSFNLCSRWTRECRRTGGKTPGPWSFKYFPWTKEMHDTNCEFWVGQKAAQMGYTETVLNRTFYKIDVDRVDCLYVLPAKTPDASDFSSGRFDAALDDSPYLTNLFSDVKNIGHKRAGSTNLYIRGSRSKSGLKSIPVGLLILDEVEEMTQENIPLAFERQSGQLQKQKIAISTPRVPGRGINLLYEQTTKEHFFFPCPACSRQIEFTFPESIIITAESMNDPRIKDTHLICNQCKTRLEHQAKPSYLGMGKWVESIIARDSRGFYINQLYSSTVSPPEIATSFFRAQLNPADEQEFHNSKLGMTHTVAGARVSDEEITTCIGGYRKKSQIPKSGILTLGVDQGRWIHYEINQWFLGDDINDINSCSIPRILDADKVLNFEDLDKLMYDWGINFCVIDAQPERREAARFAARFPGRVRLCFYARGIQGKNLHEGTDINEPTLNVDRTYWMDTALSRFRKKRITLPIDIGMEYRNHIMAPMRVYEKDEHGNTISRYVKAEADQDHHAHARTYAEIALPLAIGCGVTKSISSPR